MNRKHKISGILLIDRTYESLAERREKRYKLKA
jgi:hypothetical protein